MALSPQPSKRASVAAELVEAGRLPGGACAPPCTAASGGAAGNWRGAVGAGRGDGAPRRQRCGQRPVALGARGRLSGAPVLAGERPLRSRAPGAASPRASQSIGRLADRLVDAHRRGTSRAGPPARLLWSASCMARQSSRVGPAIAAAQASARATKSQTTLDAGAQAATYRTTEPAWITRRVRPMAAEPRELPAARGDGVRRGDRRRRARPASPPPSA